MTESQLQCFRQALERQLKESMFVFELLNRAVNRTHKDLKEESRDKSVLYAEIEQLLHQADQERQRVGEIHMALNRMERGDYGICVSCRKRISLTRLEIFPTARFCAGCTRLMEQQKKNRARG